MCREGRPEGVGGNLRVFSGKRADAYLIRRHPPRGYVVVIWRGRHVADPTELAAEEATEYWREVLAVARAVERCFHPAKLNLAMLGNVVPHLHTHVLPRYLDDPAPESPLPYTYWSSQVELPADVFAADVAALRALLQP